MRCFLKGLAICLMAGALGASAARADATDCRLADEPRNADNALIITACTAVIDDPRANRETRTLAFHARGMAQHGLRQHDAAIADFTQAIALRANDAQLYLARANTLRNKGSAADAMADFDRAVTLNPNSVIARYGRGDALATIGERARAVEDFEAAMALPASTRRELRTRELAQQRLTQLGVLKIGRRVALVVGNAAYKNASVLLNPANDARAMAAKLKQLGFAEVIEVIDADLNALGEALKRFGDLADGADWAVVFYSGHGLEMAGINYLIPVDAKLARDTHVKDETIALERVLEKVEGAKKLRLVILDACRNNPFATQMVRSAGATRQIGRGLAEIVSTDAGTQVVYAAKHGNVALDGTGTNSPFTESLLAHVEEPAVDFLTLVGKVRQSVLAKTNNAQEPWLYGAPSAERHYFKLN